MKSQLPKALICNEVFTKLFWTSSKVEKKITSHTTYSKTLSKSFFSPVFPQSLVGCCILHPLFPLPLLKFQFHSFFPPPHANCIDSSLIQLFLLITLCCFFGWELYRCAYHLISSDVGMWGQDWGEAVSVKGKVHHNILFPAHQKPSDLSQPCRGKMNLNGYTIHSDTFCGIGPAPNICKEMA